MHYTVFAFLPETTGVAARLYIELGLGSFQVQYKVLETVAEQEMMIEEDISHTKSWILLTSASLSTERKEKDKLRMLTKINHLTHEAHIYKTDAHEMCKQ